MAMDMSITAIIAADVAGFMSGIQTAKGAIEQLKSTSESGMGGLGQKMQIVGTAAAGVGAALTAGLTVPLAAVGKASVNAFADWDEALIGVAKTTNMGGKELNAFGDQIMGLSREIPVGAVELANLAEMAAQLGVKGTDNLLEFTKISA
ncbi:phage tail tape measure protein, partial [Streptococcus danieliae]|nr:phage tail tape measure protein [Streptococcus danieliae]